LVPSPQQRTTSDPLPFLVFPVGASSDPLSMTGSSWQWQLYPQRYSRGGDTSALGASHSWNSVAEQNSQENGDPCDLNDMCAIVFEYPANESTMHDMHSLDVSLAPPRELNKSSILQTGTRSHNGSTNTTLRRSKVLLVTPSDAINALEEEEEGEEEAHDSMTQECVISSSNEGVSCDNEGSIHNILDGALRQYGKLKPEACTPNSDDRLPYPHWIFQVEAQGSGDSNIGKYQTDVHRGPRRSPLSVQEQLEQSKQSFLSMMHLNIPAILNGKLCRQPCAANESCGMVGNVDIPPVAEVLMPEEVVSEHRSRDDELEVCRPMIEKYAEMHLMGPSSPKQRTKKASRRDGVASKEKSQKSPVHCSTRAEDLLSSQLEDNAPSCCAPDESYTHETPSPAAVTSAITPVCGDEVLQKETTVHEGKEDDLVPPKTFILDRSNSRPRTPEPVPFDEQETDNESYVALVQRSPTSVAALFLKDNNNTTREIDKLGTARCDTGAKLGLVANHSKPRSFGNASSDSQLVDSCLAVQDALYDLFENSAHSMDGCTSSDRDRAPQTGSDESGLNPPHAARMRTIPRQADEDIVARDSSRPSDCEEKDKKDKKVNTMALLPPRTIEPKHAAPAVGLAKLPALAHLAERNGKRATPSKDPSGLGMTDECWSTHDFVCTLFGSPQEDETNLERDKVWITPESLCEILAFACQAQINETSDNCKQGHFDSNETSASEAILEGEKEGPTTSDRRELCSAPNVPSLMDTTGHNEAKLGATSSSLPEIAALQKLVKGHEESTSVSLIDEAPELEEWIHPSDRPGGGGIGEKRRCNMYLPRWGGRRLPSPLSQRSEAWHDNLCVIQESLQSVFSSCHMQQDFEYPITVPASLDTDSESDDYSQLFRYPGDPCRGGGAGRGGDVDDTQFVQCGPHLASRSWTTTHDELSEVSEGWSLRT
jgi:hypothetical protein